MRTLDEIRNTPVLLLTPEEISQLDERSQVWARLSQARHRLEHSCPKHEVLGASGQRGYYSLRCKNCGKDMSRDSGD